ASALPPAEYAVCSAGRHPRALTPQELTTALPAARAAGPHPVLPDTPAYDQYGRQATTYAHGDPEEAYLAMPRVRLREKDVLFSVPKAYEPAGLRDTVFLPLFSGASAVLDPGLRSITLVTDRVRTHRASVLLSTSAFLTRVAADPPRSPLEPLRM